MGDMLSCSLAAATATVQYTELLTGGSNSNGQHGDEHYTELLTDGNSNGQYTIYIIDL
jgi:hypothetical protein